MTDPIVDLIEYCRTNKRVCPRPKYWSRLWKMLVDREQPSTGEEPPPPLILAGWEQSDENKKNRLKEHIKWADRHGDFDTVDKFLRDLEECSWYHSK